MSISKRTATRILESVPGILSWSVLLFPLIFSFIVPEIVAAFYILFSLFWLLRALSFSFYLIWNYYIFRRQESVDWTYIYSSLADSRTIAFDKHIPGTLRQLIRMRENTHIHPVGIRDIKNIIIIPTYKEPYEILADTIQSIRKSNFNLKQVTLVIATEERDHENATATAAKLEKKFSHFFEHFLHVEHPKNIPGEVPGKGGNISFACKKTVAYLQGKGELTPETTGNYIVTTIDADNRLHTEYLRILTIYFFLTPDRQHFSYQPLPFLCNNLWDVPIFNRLVAISSTFWHLIESGRRDKLRNFSSHAQPLEALIDMNYWSTNTIVEDGHQFWRSYIHFRGKYAVIPIFIPIFQDAVGHEKYISSLLAQYKQLRRWAYGAEDFAYVIKRTWQLRRELPIWKTFFHILQLLEGHIMWATAPLILTFSSYTPKILSPHFIETTIYYNLSIIMGYLFSLSFVGIVVSIWISLVTLPPFPKNISIKRTWYLRISLVLQWFLLPFTTTVFAALPALETQTRLIFGNKLGFNVTEKVRKNP
ncbi:MAG: glycosyltransferase [Candidatus Gracilibacteria bacterium]